MTAPANYFEESIRGFDQKKQKCLKYISDVETKWNEFHKEFPPVQDDNDNTNLDALSIIDDTKKKIQEEQLRILIAGQFKAGKSTLINAILGQDVLPAYSTPCTAVITEIHYAEKPKAILFFKKDIRELPDDLYHKTREHIEKYGKKNIPPLEINSDNFTEELEDYLVIPMSDKEQAQSVAESPYELCRLYWNLPLCKHGALIIDSPGLNEANARDKTTMEYIPKADMILHVLTALQCYAKPDAQFINDLKTLGSFPLLFLINRFDQLNNDKERERVKKFALDKLIPDSTYSESGIFFLSALSALEGREHSNSELFAQSGFEIFEKKVADVFSKERASIKLGNIKIVNKYVSEMAEKNIPNIRQKLDANIEDLEKAFKKEEENFKKLEERKERVEHNLKNDAEKFKKRIDLELMNFFADFAGGMLENIINETSISEVSFLNRKENLEKVSKELQCAAQEGLKIAVTRWSNTTGKSIFERSVKEMQDNIEWEMKQFNEQLLEIRQNLSIEKVSEMENIDFDIMDIMQDGLLGGALGGGAAFVASRLILAAAGPIGWVITGLSALAGLFAALANASKAEEEIKSTFFVEASKQILEHRKEWVTDISQEINKSFDFCSEKISLSLHNHIENTKLPIVQAIQTLKDNENNLNVKKACLDVFMQDFKELANEGENIQASL